MCSSSQQFRLAGQKGFDAAASHPPNQHYSKLHFKIESALAKKPVFCVQNLAFKNIVFLLKFPREKIYALEAFVYKASRGIKKVGVKLSAF